jgi:DNA-directed RNA polymerase specialized sigma24 family protein
MRNPVAAITVQKYTFRHSTPSDNPSVEIANPRAARGGDVGDVLPSSAFRRETPHCRHGFCQNSFMTTPGITVWLDRLKAGDRTEAVERLWAAYFERMTRLACRHLGVRRAAVDGEDVALAAFDSFLRAAEAGRFPRLDDRDDLWQVLFVLTARKAVDELQAAGRFKRGGGTLAVSADDAVPSPGPDPAEAALLAEEVDMRLAALADPVLQRIAIWKLESFSNDEIAAMLDRSVPTVERKLKRIRQIWSRDDSQQTTIGTSV